MQLKCLYFDNFWIKNCFKTFFTWGHWKSGRHLEIGLVPQFSVVCSSHQHEEEGIYDKSEMGTPGSFFQLCPLWFGVNIFLPNSHGVPSCEMVPSKSPPNPNPLTAFHKMFQANLGWSTQFKVRGIYPLFLSTSHLLAPPFQVPHYPSRYPASPWHSPSAKAPICLASCFQPSSPSTGLQAAVPPGHTCLPFTRTNLIQTFGVTDWFPSSGGLAASTEWKHLQGASLSVGKGPSLAWGQRGPHLGVG